MSSHIKVLSKNDRVKSDATQTETSDEEIESVTIDNCQAQLLEQGGDRLKHGSEAKTFKLIDEREWNIVSSEPSSETTFFADGHSALSIISVIGSKGVGKSTLLNRIARREIFKTYETTPTSSESSRINVKHTTKGIDIHSTHHRMLLDCQPLLAFSILEDFLTGHSNSQFPKNSLISDPLTSCHMISLQLATFLIATSDYVIIMTDWLIDVHLLKLIASAIMMIGKDNLRAKFVVYSRDQRVHDDRFKLIIDKSLGRNRVERYFSIESDLLDYIRPYSSEKCELYNKDPLTFSGKNWLASCQRLWNTTIRNSSMFSDYALQLYNSNNINT